MNILFFETKTGIPVTLWLGCVGATDGFSMVALNKHCLNKLLNKMIIVQKSVKLRGDDDDDDEGVLTYLVNDPLPDGLSGCFLQITPVKIDADADADNGVFCNSHQGKLSVYIFFKR